MSCRPETVEIFFLHIPKGFYVLHIFFTLTANVMFVNLVVLLTNLSRDIRMFADKYLESCASTILSSSLNKVACLYSQRLFIVRVILMFLDFEKVKK